jgi:hypothetical protein
MPIRTAVAVLSVLVLGLAFPDASSAQSDALLKVQERAKLLEDFRGLLNHSEASMRRAAFEEAMDSDDEALTGMALDMALGGEDVELQTAALRWIIRTRSQLPLTLSLPSDPDEAQETTYQEWHGTVLDRLELVSPGDELTFRGPGYSNSGQLVPGGLDLRMSDNAFSCAVALRVAGADLLTGNLECSYPRSYVEHYGGTRAVLPVRIDLS